MGKSWKNGGNGSDGDGGGAEVVVWVVEEFGWWIKGVVLGLYERKEKRRGNSCTVQGESEREKGEQ
jgi:hypothetical protein